MCNRPVGQDSAAAAAGDSELFRIDVALFEHLVDARHQVTVIVAWVAVLNDVSKLLAVAG